MKSFANAKKSFAKFAAVPALALVATPALAQSQVDVSSVVTEIQGAAAPIAAIGAAVLIVLVGIKVYKWVRRAL